VSAVLLTTIVLLFGEKGNRASKKKSIFFCFVFYLSFVNQKPNSEFPEVIMQIYGIFAASSFPSFVIEVEPGIFRNFFEKFFGHVFD